jgi:hypothetical protein
VVNNDIENASLWSPTKEPLGKNNILLTPGGDQNYLNIDLRMLSAKTQPKVDLSLVHELSSNPEGGQTPPQLLVAACRAEIMRLERRRIAVAYKLDEVRNKINTPPPGASPDDIEKTMSDGKALSLRLRSIDKMLSSRKAIFESLGATDAQYRQTIDDAAGGANFSLDLSTKPVQILSDIGAGSVGSDLPKNRTPKKGRLLRMLEPVIRLLPPMTDEERAAMQASRASTSSYPADVAVPTPTTPDGLQLRPSLPEPEPEVSDTSRGRRVAPAEEPKKSKAVNPWKKTEEENAKKASAKTAEKKSAVKGAKGKSSKSPTDAKTGKSKKGKKAAEPIPTRTQSKRSKQSTSASKKKSALVPASSTSHRRRRHN